MSATRNDERAVSCKQTTDGAHHYDCSRQHALLLLRKFEELWQSEDFCDVELVVGHRVFHAHRSMLCACSPYFCAMFTSDLCERSKSQIHIHEVEPAIFEKLLHFMYTGKIEVNAETCQDLLAAADMLEISAVVSSCCSFLKQQLCPSNCIGIYLFAELRAFTEVKSISESYIYSNFIAVTQEEEYTNLSKEVLIHLLQSEMLHIEAEAQVFSAALKWILHDVKSRRKDIFDILNTIRFPLIPNRQLQKCINELTDFSLKIALRKYTQNFTALDIKRPHLKPYMFCTRKGARKKIFVIGGYSRNPGGRWSESQSLPSVECFDSFHELWAVCPPLHHARSGHGVVALNGKIYVIGGESDSLIYDSAECYDVSVNKWTLLPCLTVPRCGLGVCELDGFIYAIGGWVGSQIGDTIERFDPDLDEWHQVGHLRSLRYSIGVTTHEGLIYIVGGISDMSTEMRLTESYNPATQEFTKLADMREKRAHLAVAVLDGYLYAVGGWNEYKGALSTVERYSISEDKWEDVASMTTPRAGACVIPLNGLLYVIGGRSSNEEFSAPVTLDIVECFDPNTDSWFTITPMSTSRCEAGVAMI